MNADGSMNHSAASSSKAHPPLQELIYNVQAVMVQLTLKPITISPL